MSYEEKAAWRRCWREQRIDGFHQTEPNELLLECWPRLNLPPGCRVFVPLCGKSLDMVWLAAQGFEVFGVELSTIAAGDFFRALGLHPERQDGGSFSLFSAAGITIAAGDFFRLRAEDLRTIEAVYDRAALRALPPDERDSYVAHLVEVLPREASMLLITTEDDVPPTFSGHPAPVDEEIARLYAGRYQVELLQALKLPPSDATTLHSNSQLRAYRLTRQGDDTHGD